MAAAARTDSRLEGDASQEGHGSSDAPFVTPTLARLYLDQGHHEQARRLARRLQASGAGSPALDTALDQEDRRRQAVLQGLLARVRANRR